jgi:predicted enzyme related to lactoylglutathione lyase
MTTPTSFPIGAPIWIDLFSSDTDRAAEFYGALFGWTAESAGPDFGGYINFSLDGRRVAGCMRNDGSQGTPDTWSIYLHTTDAAATAAAAAANGGTVYVPAMPVGDLGVMALLADPSNAAIGVWQPGAHAGFGVLAEPGAPSWFELHTPRYAEVVAFHREVFGWDARTMSDSPEFRYTTLLDGPDMAAGIMDNSMWVPTDTPGEWSVYLQVVDTDATLATALGAGATLVHGPEDTPYGRIAALADPTGARFKLQQPPT